MKTIKVSEATQRQLDWLVAKCGGRALDTTDPNDLWLSRDGIADQPLHSYTPSSDWAQGGPIIERIKGLEFKHWLESKPESCCEVRIHNYEGDWVAFGPTPLIAVMRSYVASKLGETVEVPDELI